MDRFAGIENRDKESVADSFALTCVQVSSNTHLALVFVVFPHNSRILLLVLRIERAQRVVRVYGSSALAWIQRAARVVAYTIQTMYV
jgi:hypothetical protein